MDPLPPPFTQCDTSARRVSEPFEKIPSNPQACSAILRLSRNPLAALRRVRGQTCEGVGASLASREATEPNRIAPNKKKLLTRGKPP